MNLEYFELITDKKCELEVRDEDILFFHDFWEDDFNAYCYGDEKPLLEAFEIFFKNLKGDCYDYQKLSKLYGDERLCWSIIIHLKNLDLIDWGTSIRFGFLNSYKTDKAYKIRDIFNKYDIPLLYQIIHLDKYEDGQKTWFEQK